MAKIAKKIEELTGNSENEQKMREQFTFLQKMAEAKSAQFKAELKEMYIGNGTEKSEVTGSRAISYYSSQHVDIKVGCDDAINSAIDSFFKGKSGVKEGFHKLISCAVDTLIGNSSIGEHQEDMFFIYPENNAIVRVDVKAYKYTFSKKGFIADCENVFCYTMAKSIVDHTKLTKDELVYFVTQMCTGSNNNGDYHAPADAIVALKEIMDFVNELITIWNLLDQQILSSNSQQTNHVLRSAAPQPRVTPEQIEACNNAEGALTFDEVSSYMENHTQPD